MENDELRAMVNIAGENTVVATTTYVTQRGIDYIRKLIKDGKLVAQAAACL